MVDQQNGRDSPDVKKRISIWLYPLRDWLFHYPLLLGTALLVVAMPWGLVGADFGIPYLFWTDEPWTEGVAGFALACLLGKLCFNGYLLASDARWMKDETGRPRPLEWYLLRTWLPLLCVVFARVLIPASGDNSYAHLLSDVDYWHFLFKHAPFVIGLVSGVMLSVLFALLAEQIQARLIPLWLLRMPRLKRQLPAEVHDEAQQGDRQFVSADLQEEVPVTVRLHALSASFFGLFTLTYLGLVFARSAYQYVTPAMAMCLLLALATDIYAFIRFHWPSAVYPIGAALIVVALLFSMSPYKHRYADLAEFYAHKEPFNDKHYRESRRKDCGLIQQGALAPWLAYYRDHQAPNRESRPTMVVVATSGGGLRAANWTAVVLNELERSRPGFFYHVRLITGASGGMLGASHFVAKLDELQKFDVEHNVRTSAQLPTALLEQRNQLLGNLKIVDNLEKSSLESVARFWALQDVPRCFCPLAYDKDRGWALEESWSENLHGALDHPVRDLCAGEQAGWRPSLVFSPMLVEDGRRLLISNLNLDAITRTNGRLASRRGAESGLYSLSAVEFFRLFPKADNFRLRTAVRMNASFPYASPVSTLPTEPARRVVDAGYYDNFGIEVAASWIYDHQKWIQENTSGVLLIQIRDSISQQTGQVLGTEEEHNAPSWWSQGLQELTTPVEAVLTARTASMSFRNDEQLRNLNFILNSDRSRPDMFATVVIECPVAAELNWSLTKEEVEAIRSGIAQSVTGNMHTMLRNRPGYQSIRDKNRQRVDHIARLLGRGTAGSEPDRPTDPARPPEISRAGDPSAAR